MFKETGKFC